MRYLLAIASIIAVIVPHISKTIIFHFEFYYRYTEENF
jgi:hypothetical protein